VSDVSGIDALAARCYMMLRIATRCYAVLCFATAHKSFSQKLHLVVRLLISFVTTRASLVGPLAAMLC